MMWRDTKLQTSQRNFNSLYSVFRQFSTYILCL